MTGPRTTWWAIGALAAAVVVGACSGGGGSSDGGAPAVTLPPIVTTSTLPPPTTLNRLDQDRFVTIQQGDILSEIAKQYDVSQDSLMAMNGITDPDAVYVGQVLELPPEAVLANSGPTSLVATTTSP